MKIIKPASLITSTLIFLVIITASCGKKKEPTLKDKLIGTWEMVIKPNILMIFHEDGTITVIENKNKDKGKWEITENKNINITIKDEKVTGTLEPNGDSIFRIKDDKKGSTFTFKKRTNPNIPLNLSQRGQKLLINKTEKKAIMQQNRNNCIHNLKCISAAKAQAMIENNLPDNAIIKEADITPYLNTEALPKCPSGGTYNINRGNQDPTCTFNNHELK